MGSICHDEGELQGDVVLSSLQRKREQVVQACERCRRSRVKCDTERPCQRCKRGGKECVDGQGKRNRFLKTEEQNREDEEGASEESWEDLLISGGDLELAEGEREEVEDGARTGMGSLESWLNDIPESFSEMIANEIPDPQGDEGGCWGEMWEDSFRVSEFSGSDLTIPSHIFSLLEMRQNQS
eukprot:763223-Hanusia_phi.AAC.2